MALLLESGDELLLESGSFLLLESDSGAPTVTGTVAVAGGGTATVAGTRTVFGTAAVAGGGVATVAGFVNGTYSEQVLADDPISYYRLGEASGTTAVDSSGNAQDGTYAGSPVFAQAGALGGDADTAVQFGTSGTADARFTVPSAAFAPGAGSFTLECWLKTATLTGDRTAFLFYDAGGETIRILVSAQTIAVNGVSTTPAFFTTTNRIVSTSVWYHLVFVLDSVALTGTLYLDGVQIQQASGPAFAGGALTGRTIGGDTGANSWRGHLDEVALYHTALSATRVATHYATGAPGATVTGTVAVSGGGTATVTGKRTVSGTSAVLGGGTATVAGTRVVTGTAAVAGGGSATVIGKRTVTGSAAVSGGGLIVIAGAGFAPGAGFVTVSGGGVVAVAGTRTVFGTANVSGGGTLTVTGTRTALGTVAVVGGGVITVIGSGGAPTIVTGTVSVLGGGLLTVSGTRTASGVVLVLGGGVVTVTAAGAVTRLRPWSATVTAAPNMYAEVT